MKKAITVLMFGVVAMILTGCNMTNNGGMHTHIHDVTGNLNASAELKRSGQQMIREGLRPGLKVGTVAAGAAALANEIGFNGPYSVADFVKDARKLKNTYDESKDEIESIKKSNSWFSTSTAAKVIVPVATVALVAYKWTHSAPEAPKYASASTQADPAYESPYLNAPAQQEIAQEGNWDVPVQPLQYPEVI
jgi:hypothetical protein